MLILREFWPDRPGAAWLGGGIVAFIPQFVAMMAAINNDALTLALAVALAVAGVALSARQDAGLGPGRRAGRAAADKIDGVRRAGVGGVGRRAARAARGANAPLDRSAS